MQEIALKREKKNFRDALTNIERALQALKRGKVLLTKTPALNAGLAVLARKLQLNI